MVPDPAAFHVQFLPLHSVIFLGKKEQERGKEKQKKKRKEERRKKSHSVGYPYASFN